MRVWLVIGSLGGLLLAAVGVRSWQGWSATPRERHAISCERRVAKACEEVGLDYLNGTSGPVDEAEGLKRLEQGCSLKRGSSCEALGEALARSTRPGHETDALVAFDRGCRLRVADSCAQVGWSRHHAADLSAKEQGRTMLVDACGNGSGLGCERLARVLVAHTPTRDEVAESVRLLGTACQLGDQLGCLGVAQARACGRGVAAAPSEALRDVRRLCEADVEGACAQELALDPSDSGVDLAFPGRRAAAIDRLETSVSIISRDAGLEALAELDAGPELRLIEVELALRDGALDEAEAALAQSSGPPAELQTARHTLAARRAGLPWPDATWVGWARAGRPNLAASKLVGWADRAEAPFFCSPQSAPDGPLATDQDFIRAVASTQSRSAIDPAYHPLVVEAALRFASSGAPPTRLLALGVLAELHRQSGAKAIQQLEEAARAQYATAHHATLLEGLLRFPSQLQASAATDEDLTGVEALLELPPAPSGADLYDAYLAALPPGPASERQAFALVVMVLVDLVPFQDLPAWLANDQLEAARRARVLTLVAQRLDATGLLVHAFQRVRLEGAAVALQPDAEAEARWRAHRDEVNSLYWGPVGLHALGNWGWPSLGSPRKLLEGTEVAEVRRLHRLAEEAR